MRKSVQVGALEGIRKRIIRCRACGLCDGALNAVPGEGSDSAKIMFIGEAPGKGEDLQGKPFVGAAGRFLNLLLEGAGISRDEIFITNVVKHRPPGNRDPLPNEIEACRPYLEQQIGALDPLVIVTLGRHALGRFLPGCRISDVHGTPQHAAGTLPGKYVIYPMYHPASALYNPGLRETLLKDMKKVASLLRKSGLLKLKAKRV